MRKIGLLALGFAGLTAACSRASSGTAEIRITKGAGGVGFLPLLMMEKNRLIEKYAAEAGIANPQVRWIEIGGPSAVNDALLSGSADFAAAGPTAFLTLWDKTRTSAKITGVAAMTSLPMYLNTREPRLTKLEDFTDRDKIAVTAIKISIPSLAMQMYAREKYGPAETARFDKYTVPMTHPDGVIALISGSGAVSAHFTSPPFHQRERKDPRIRTILTTNDIFGGPSTFTMVYGAASFREHHPKLYAAFLSALEEANKRIVADKRAAAELLMGDSGRSGEGGFNVDELTGVLGDPDIRFTTAPERVMKYVEFLASTGSIQNRPASWKDLFFPEIHKGPGS
jgi:NitT/TauT family transport system substrate-binding protein